VRQASPGRTGDGPGVDQDDARDAAERDPLERSRDGQGRRHQPYQRAEDLGRAWIEAAPRFHLQGVERPQIRREGGGHYRDFVFIDANHSYECVVKDIKAWTPKLRPGGMLSGHDFSDRYSGVVGAVTELVSDFSLGVDRVWRCKKEDVK
ncbi:hypothetical protein LCGC14_3007230, partial [marine sediment metagenome]